MKVTKLTIKNIGKLVDETIPLDKPLILFYGEIRQGKSTILNAVRWVCGGAFPSDIIRHGQTEASVALEFEGGVISRTWYIAKDKTTKAREVVFVRNGKPVERPATELRRFLNPFLLDQDHLKNLGEAERKKFFTDLFAVDTAVLDTELFKNHQSATALRSKLQGYGEIDLTPVEAIDVAKLKAELADIRSNAEQAVIALEESKRKILEAHSEEVWRARRAGAEAADFNTKVREAEDEADDLRKNIARLETELAEAKSKLTAIEKWHAANPLKNTDIPLPPTPDVSDILDRIQKAKNPDTSALEERIQNAAAQNVRADQFLKNQKRADQRTADENELAALEQRGREIKAEKTAKLKAISESCGVAGLAFDEAGNFIYQGTQSGMLSTSQIMRLSSDLSALYPEGFGLDLIDRAESLGKSIFEFVERAKREDKTILATIVGERPAATPPEVGIFIVEEGKLRL
jgi:hypothetical protein